MYPRNIVSKIFKIKININFSTNYSIIKYLTNQLTVANVFEKLHLLPLLQVIYATSTVTFITVS